MLGVAKNICGKKNTVCDMQSAHICLLCLLAATFRQWKISNSVEGKINLVVVSLSGSLAVFWRLFFLKFRQSLWPASSEDWSRSSVHALLLLDSWVFIAVATAFVLFEEIGWLWWSACFCCGCIVVMRGRDDLSLWLMGVVSWSFVCSDHQSLWLDRVHWPVAGYIFQCWEPGSVEC